MVVCDPSTAHVFDLSDTQRAPARECKPTDFEVPKTFLNHLQDLSSCFLKDIAGKDGLGPVFLEVIVIMQSPYLDQSSSSNLIWFDISKTLIRAFRSIAPGTLSLEV